MAIGSVFIPVDHEPYYDWVLIEYPDAGYPRADANTNMHSKALHEEYRQRYNSNARILEISRCAEAPGNLLSTKYAKMQYEFTKPYKRKRTVYIETVYHGSKCFEHGGPFEDLISSFKTPYTARNDKRLKENGRLNSFHFNEKFYPAYPAASAFFDWLYISALQSNSSICDIAPLLFEYDAFTSYEFNAKTQMCIVCPARVAAMYVGMTKAGVLTNPVDFKTLAMLDGMMLQADMFNGEYEIDMSIAPKEESVEVKLEYPPVEVEIGEQIIHKLLGPGTVCEINETSLKIDFGIKGVKTFLNPSAFDNGFLRKPSKPNI
jgi:hypothetical protein